MNNRICPDEYALSEYLSGSIRREEQPIIEEHLARCPACRKLVSESHDVLKGARFSKALSRLAGTIKRNAWLICALAALWASFLFPKYFLQFLAAASLAGVKWIIDSKTTKMLITVYDALKHSDKPTGNRHSSLTKNPRK